MSLPPESRIQLADMLYESVDENAQVEVDPELLVELDRRVAAYERGEMKTYTHEQIFEKLLPKSSP